MTAESSMQKGSLSSGGVEIVITAPEPYSTDLAMRSGTRMTLGTLTQMIASAKRYVILSVPYVQEHDSAGTPIYEALERALGRGVNVDLVSTITSLQVLRRKPLAEASKGRLRLFRPQANIEDESRIGSHAKVCVCDGAHAYVGSANLTGPGLTRNFELGVLVHGKTALQIADFWKLLFEERFFVEVGYESMRHETGHEN